MRYKFKGITFCKVNRKDRPINFKMIVVVLLPLFHSRKNQLVKSGKYSDFSILQLNFKNTFIQNRDSLRVRVKKWNFSSLKTIMRNKSQKNNLNRSS